MCIVSHHPEHWDINRVSDLDKALLFKIISLIRRAINQYKDWSCSGLPMLIEWYKKFLKRRSVGIKILVRIYWM